MPVVTLKRRAEFLKVRGGARWASTSFVLEAKRRVGKETPPNASAGPGCKPAPAAGCGGLGGQGARFGFTVTKKIGGAVQRNRIRRRLKAAAGLLAADLLQPQTDYVLVARSAALTRPFADLTAELQVAMQRVNRPTRRPSAQAEGRFEASRRAAAAKDAGGRR